MTLQTDTEIKALLERSKNVAIIGYSDDPSRPSYDVAHRLQEFGYHIYPVNPTLAAKGGTTGDLKVYASLAEVPVPLDIVDVFRRADALPDTVKEAISVGAKAVWMQLGIVNDEAAQQAEAAGLAVVMDHCMNVEHQRLIGT
jgi:predicted CoA-binding protein